VAVKVQEVPFLINVVVNVATPDPSVTALTEPPRLHAEVMLMVSPVTIGDSVTVKLNGVADVCGDPIAETTRVEAADAGETAANARPASIRADIAPMATNDFIRVLKERWPTSRFAEFIIGFPPLHFPSGLNA
jgi:hypothetical protein